MSKFVIDLVITDKKKEDFLTQVYCADYLYYDEAHDDLVIHSYGLVNYLKHPREKIIQFKLREIPD